MTRSTDPNRRCLPVTEWPTGDAAAWLRAQTPQDPLDAEAGYATRWRPSTIGLIESGYGRWLGWLSQIGELDAETRPTDRATRERVRRYLDALEDAGLADYTRALRLRQLGDALRAMQPGCDVDWIVRGASRIHAHARPARDDAAKLRPAEDVLRLGLDLMDAADNDRFRSASERAVLFRDGLLIALLTYRPLRLANLAAIALGQQLRQCGDGWSLRFDGAETKASNLIECAWPQELDQALHRYLDIHRPVLLRGAATDALWIAKGGRGGGMTSDAIAVQIQSRTAEEFGTPINPHAFRSIAATMVATEDPESVDAASAILSHSSRRTTEKHYNRAKMIDAGARYHEALRCVGRKPRKAPRASAS